MPNRINNLDVLLVLFAGSQGEEDLMLACAALTDAGYTEADLVRLLDVAKAAKEFIDSACAA